MADKNQKKSAESGLFLGRSPEIMRLKKVLKDLSQKDNFIFILGEAGTGKEYTAKQIYELSPRKKHALVTIDCLELGKSIDDKDLYGEATESDRSDAKTVGLLEQANHGVLLLKNIAEMKPEYQADFLQILRTKKFRRVGGSDNIDLDVRVISTSDHDLKHEIETDKFKKDLFFLLNTYTFYLPPLRERIQDIPDLFAHFLNKYCEQQGREVPAVPSEIFESLLDYEWKGNVGELESTIQNLVMMSPEDQLSAEALPFRVKKHPYDFLEPKNLKKVMSDIETFIIKKAMSKVGWNQVKAAKLLGIPEATLRFKMKKHSISKKNR